MGTKFTTRPSPKVTRENTVVDFWVTRNLAGEVVRVRYVSTNKMLGQNVFNYDVVQTTIDRGLIA